MNKQTTQGKSQCEIAREDRIARGNSYLARAKQEQAKTERKWGTRCPDYMEGCALCAAWKILDQTGKTATSKQVELELERIEAKQEREWTGKGLTRLGRSHYRSIKTDKSNQE